MVFTAFANAGVEPVVAFCVGFIEVDVVYESHIGVYAVQTIKVGGVEYKYMATDDSQSPSEEERMNCRVVTEVALRKAGEKCGDDAMKEQLRMMLGFTQDKDDPDCPAVMEDGVTEARVNSASGMNEWVFCRAWQEYQTEDVDNIGEALEKAWAEAEARAEEKGMEV